GIRQQEIDSFRRILAVQPLQLRRIPVRYRTIGANEQHHHGFFTVRRQNCRRAARGHQEKRESNHVFTLLPSLTTSTWLAATADILSTVPLGQCTSMSACAASPSPK